MRPVVIRHSSVSKLVISFLGKWARTLQTTQDATTIISRIYFFFNRHTTLIIIGPVVRYNNVLTTFLPQLANE